MRFRDIIKKLGPGWLVRDVITMPDGSNVEVDSRLFRAVMTWWDVRATRLKLGLYAALPGLAPADALSYIGNRLGIERGPEEPRASYEYRLQRGIDDKRVAGNAWALLEQIRGYCTPHAVRVRIVNEHGHWYTIDRDGTRSRYRNSTWDWDGASARAELFGTRIPWSRFWVLIYPTTGSPKEPWDRDGTWGNGELWGDNLETETWGSTASPADVLAIQRIIQRWKPAASRCVSAIIVFDDAAFDPADTSPPLADGTWKNCGRYGVVAGRKTVARSVDAIYWRASSGVDPA